MKTLHSDEQIDSVRKLVREGYAAIAQETTAGCCGTGVSCCGSTPKEADKLARELGYTVEELKALPDGANMGLSCGNPAALGGIARKPKGLAVTLIVNWLVKPFSMAFLGWLFMQHIFSAWISPELAKEYTAGLIILAAAPCTAMVFVWSYLTDGDPVYTLVQVAVNDLIMLVAFAPIVMFLCGVAHVVVPAKVLITSVVVFIVIPLAAGWLTRTALLKSHGKDWFEQKLLPKFHPVTIFALLLTLVLIFAFQAENLTTRWLAVLLLAVPIVIQVYFNSTLAYLLMRRLRVPHNVASPGALIGASNFFELAVAVAITLFGAGSGAALATVVGVLVEVPVMLSVCKICNQSRGWYGKMTNDE